MSALNTRRALNQFTDPRFERLEVHSVRVLRAGAVIDHTNSPGFEVFPAASDNMERLVFDGRLTVHFTVPDVRVGDVVETCFSLYGMRRSLGNRHATWITFEWPAGIIDARHRLRVPDGKIVRRRAVNNPPETQEKTRRRRHRVFLAQCQSGPP